MFEKQATSDAVESTAEEELESQQNTISTAPSLMSGQIAGDKSTFAFWRTFLNNCLNNTGRLPLYNELSADHKAHWMERMGVFEPLRSEFGSTSDIQEFDDLTRNRMLTECHMNALTDIVKEQCNDNNQYDGMYRMEDILLLDNYVQPMQCGAVILHCHPSLHYVMAHNIDDDMVLYDGKFNEHRDNVILRAQMTKVLRPKEGTTHIAYEYAQCEQQHQSFECGDLAIARAGDVLSKTDIFYVIYQNPNVLRAHTVAILMSGQWEPYPRVPANEQHGIVLVGGEGSTVEVLSCCGMAKVLPVNHGTPDDHRMISICSQCHEEMHWTCSRDGVCQNCA